MHLWAVYLRIVGIVSFLFACITVGQAAAEESTTAVGTIDGMFNVTLAGNATYRIPLRVAPGVAGTEPKIALFYDSQAPSGPLGPGWSIAGLSVISRGPKNLFFDGVVDGVRLAESDALFLDGQRLVPVSVTGSGDGRRIEYRKEIDDQTRIIQIGKNFSSSNFVVSTKGGIRIIFNGEGNSNITTASGATLLKASSYVFDTSGNYIEFNYNKNGHGDYNISHIRYTGHGRLHDNGTVESYEDAFAVVKFEYEDLGNPVSTYVAGQKIEKNGKRLLSIQSHIGETRGGNNSATRLAAKYTFEYRDSATANKFVLEKVRQFGEDGAELSPTRFDYSEAGSSWQRARFALPPTLSFAYRQKLAGAYRFARFAEESAGPVDLLVGAQINGQLHGLAFRNLGNGKWQEDSRFAPPFAFSNAEGDDLGALLLDVNGDGRIDLLQSHRPSESEPNRTAYLADSSGWIAANQQGLDYRLPFDLSVSGSRVAKVLTGRVSSPDNVDVLFEAGEERGFLRNTGSGWKEEPSLIPPVPLKRFARLIDVDCDGSLELLAIDDSDTENPIWRVFDFTIDGWVEDTRPEFLPTEHVPASIDAKAILEIQLFDQQCSALLVSSAETDGVRATLVATANGWQSVEEMAPSFDLVSADGVPTLAIASDVNGDGRVDVIANHEREGQEPIKFAYLQASEGWNSDSAFEPPTLAASANRDVSQTTFVGDLDGDLFPEVVVPSSTIRGLGSVFRGSAAGFKLAPEYAPKMPLAQSDKQDRGVRVVDLNGDGLPDILFHRKTSDTNEQLESKGAFINTGQGWLPSPGLIPPRPFVAEDIVGDPVRFADVDGDGFMDMLYNYRRADGTSIRGYYRSTPCSDPSSDESAKCLDSEDQDYRFDRKWVLQKDQAGNLSSLTPPASFPFSAERVGDMGVRLVDLDGDGRADILAGYLPSDDYSPIETCQSIDNDQVCELNRAPFRVAAFLNDGSTWKRAPKFDPPLPFVAQEATRGNRSTNLFVQVADVDGDRLPDIVAGFKHPVVSSTEVFETWLNTGKGWRLAKKSSLPNLPNGQPFFLDQARRDPRALVQWADMNSDGLLDIVFSKRTGETNESMTFLSTGAGFVAAGAPWKVGIDAIADRNGDPGFRLIDVNGDGLLDVIYARTDSDGAHKSGLFLNDGRGLASTPLQTSNPVPAFVGKDGEDRGVRLIDVDGNGLLDIVKSLASSAVDPSPEAEVLLNASQRSDVLASIDIGYGLKRRIFYQSLIEATPEDDTNSPATVPWNAVYVPGPRASYPKISPVPAMYVVRRTLLESGDDQSLATSYRYGEFRMHGGAMTSLGFRWRESFDEANDAQILNRTELVQDVKFRSNPLRQATCWVPIEQLSRPKSKADFARLFDPTWADLCPEAIPQELEQIKKLTESYNTWSIQEETVGGSNGLASRSIRQISLDQTKSATYELDGGLVSQQTDTFTYDKNESLLLRRQNMVEVLLERGDGSSVRTTNTYGQDDPERWFFGRLTRTEVVKTGDPIEPDGNKRFTETRVATFEYDQETGLLAVEVANAHSPLRSLRSAYTRDKYGNVVATQISTPNRLPRTTYSQFDSLSRFVVAETNPLGHTRRIPERTIFGAPKSAVDPNGLATSFQYDGFGRQTAETTPSGVSRSTEVLDPAALEDQGAIEGLDAAYVVKTRMGTLPASIDVYDNQGRVVRSISDGFSDDESSVVKVQQDTKYDLHGRTVATSLPYFRGEQVLWHRAQYDRLGRVIRATAPDNSTSLVEYEARPGGGTVTTATDALGRTKTTEFNMRETRVLVTDTEGARIRFTHDAGNRLVRVVGPTGATTRHTYNSVGHRTSTSDPDMGDWTYQYDSFGRLRQQTDAKNQITTIEYDLVGRPIKRVTNDATTTWKYDDTEKGIGQLASVAGSDGYKEEYSYDEFGRRNRSIVTIDGETFSTFTVFDELGRVKEIYYPSRLAVRNVYDKNGFLVKVQSIDKNQTYWKAEEIDQYGRVMRQLYGNGLTTHKVYSQETGRPSSIRVQRGSEDPVVNLNLQYDLVGNLKTRNEVALFGSRNPISESFEYDSLDRLIGMTRNDGTREQYEFDAAGRIVFKTGVGNYDYAPATPSNSTSNKKPYHGFESIRSGDHVDNYTYDANGNVEQAPNGTFAYTSDNRTRQIYSNGAKWIRFSYSPSGSRYHQRARYGSSTIDTVYVGSYERVTAYVGGRPIVEGGNSVLHRHYLLSTEGVFAAIEIVEEAADFLNVRTPLNLDTSPLGPPVAPTRSVRNLYFHKDQLGSVLKVTDQSGKTVANFWYDPWGKRSRGDAATVATNAEEAPGSPSNRGFTGHEHLDGFDLVHMNGRVYSHHSSTFTSVDLVNQAPDDAQIANGYQYARHNPLKYIDPSGYFSIGDIGRGLRDLGRGLRNLGRGLEREFQKAGDWLSDNWKQVVVVAAAVAITTLSGGTLSPIAAAMLSGAIMGGGMAWAYGGSFEDILIGSFTGAVMGGIGYGIGTAFQAGSWGSIAAEGHLSGVQSAMHGGDYWTGFKVGAIRQGVMPNIGEIDSSAMRIAARGTLSGAVAELEGRKFSNGALSGTFVQLYADSRSGNWAAGYTGAKARFVGGVQSTVRFVSGAIGKINTLPLTVAGALAGTAMVGISQLWSGTGSITVGDNALQFEGISFVTDPFTLGNSVIYPAPGGSGGWTPEALKTARVHERAHTYQYEVYGYQMILQYGRELGNRGYYDHATGVGNRFEEGAYRYQSSGGNSWIPY